MLKEFKTFIMRGNVMDMAVGIIIGGAFGKIITSLVNDIIMPVISILTGSVDFKHLKYVIEPAQGEIPELAVYYGQFIQNLVDFVIIAFSIFIMIKMINKLKAKPKEEAAPAKPSEEVVLLSEIRDELKKMGPSSL
ncbi:large conductance mechanosensitive channel [Acetoanaerobium noterae]|uniref:Large-conductance mechanosensitive channel n=1 Tax=Acetoanaerobium noterae TaxID=745369 RepID=A0A1T4ZRK9_9FIRM|nr:large-conductance mechanosensitive channel protein MscL [Acetoanaerobium noterae]MBP8762445.1 large-conductance mechanosensitive channel protein MscL [Acetoanaerobium sp.]MDK2803369.1 large conductance mechanosensitive channel [Peptostreptococcaceae bacterium]MBP9500211.1 large-conductance mechanosensitive channel protein MscL [Acetoanaerobium sp.]MBP9562928.1 large-conductance mechanosensitive channel protein MscL [Acetoanaerobium sp.]SKB25424.1 large conductance mechanosensitive channel [